MFNCDILEGFADAISFYLIDKIKKFYLTSEKLKLIIFKVSKFILLRRMHSLLEF
jgi:hypothetical protein